MKLIVGLGNPGSKYQQTWHNAGWRALDEFFVGHEDAFKNPKENKKFLAQIAEGKIGDEKIILAKPLTFMNNSGQAVKALADFYKIKGPDIWIIHDEIDLPIGQLRISRDASSGGHNGVKSIIEELGFKNFIRFRIGINQPDRTTPTEAYVLQKISKPTILQKMITRTAQAIEVALRDGVDHAMNQLN